MDTLLALWPRDAVTVNAPSATVYCARLKSCTVPLLRYIVGPTSHVSAFVKFAVCLLKWTHGSGHIAEILMEVSPGVQPSPKYWTAERETLSDRSAWKKYWGGLF